MAKGNTKPLRLTQHARQRLGERGIALEWIERTTRDPQWTRPDPLDALVQRRYRAIPEQGHRVLRVACVETDAEIRIITVMFGRDAEPPLPAMS